MVESNWEQKSKSHRNRLRLLLVIGVPVIIVSGIIFQNNRDLFHSEPIKKKEIVKTKNLFLTKSVQKKRINVKNDSQFKDLSPKKDRIAVIADRSPVIKNIEVLTSLVSVASIELRDRKDIRIKLSLEFFYTDVKRSSELMLRRSEISVLVKNILRKKDLREIKKDSLEIEIKKELNGIFDQMSLKDIKIREIQTEKVQTP
jgi:hypothetical protein